MNYKKAFAASNIAILSYMITFALRLASNLVLTRLLFPEAFGLIAIVQTIMLGAVLLTDVGLNLSLIQNRKGEEEYFINTVWTMRIIQSIALWLLLTVSAPIFSFIFSEPLISEVLPILSFSLIISGFISTNIFTSIRKLNLFRIELLQIFCILIEILITAIIAYYFQTIWSLVYGGLIGALIKTILSHLLLPGISNRLLLDKKTVIENINFGKWIIISSGLTFLNGEGRKLIFGTLVSTTTLALFSLANTLAMSFMLVLTNLIQKVALPIYSQTFREDPKRLKAVSLRIRVCILIPSFFVSAFFLFFGYGLMNFLYDERYTESGNILQILAVGMFAKSVTASYSGLFISRGETRKNASLVFFEVITMVICVGVGFSFYGSNGVFWGAAASSWLAYPIYIFRFSKVGLWTPKIDILTLMGGAALCFLALASEYKAHIVQL